ncbi:MAG: hypothetical protein IPH84_18275 [Bacteroidales bacterium]|nr:hypothetical protein [Bacteroidales bacterium]
MEPEHLLPDFRKFKLRCQRFATYVLRWTISNGTCAASTDDIPLPSTRLQPPLQSVLTRASAVPSDSGLVAIPNCGYRCMVDCIRWYWWHHY